MGSEHQQRESPHTRLSRVLFAEVVRRVGVERVARMAGILERVPPLKPKMADARSSDWRKYPSLYLPDIASDAAGCQAIFDAISELIAES